MSKIMSTLPMKPPQLPSLPYPNHQKAGQLPMKIGPRVQGPSSVVVAVRDAGASSTQKSSPKAYVAPKDTFEKAGAAGETWARHSVFSTGRSTTQSTTAKSVTTSQTAGKTTAPKTGYDFTNGKINQSNNLKGNDKTVASRAVKNVLDQIEPQALAHYKKLGTGLTTDHKWIDCGQWADQLKDRNGRVNTKNVQFLKDTANAHLQAAGSKVRIKSIVPERHSRNTLPVAGYAGGHNWATLKVEYVDSRGVTRTMTLVTETNSSFGGRRYHTDLK
ncbi:MAG: hypothetical protein AB1714_21515 [Acidobacteriota bacterium]